MNVSVTFWRSFNLKNLVFQMRKNYFYLFQEMKKLLQFFKVFEEAYIGSHKTWHDISIEDEKEEEE